ncbi:MAG TPA: hypothetical protein VFY49_06380 [Myxococcota bacterium]|nr:hypothetical protein [Myxococcota bacterium]
MWAVTALRASLSRAWLLALCALACASGQVVEPDGQSSARVPMQMPERVLVFEFDVSAGDSTSEAKQLADAVVTRLAEIPIPGVHVLPSTPLDGPALGVDGSFLSLDTGMRDHLRADVQLQALVNGFFEPVHRFETEASGEDKVDRTAKEIAREVALFYANQGWLEPGRVPE